MSGLTQIDPSAATDQTKDLLDELQQRLGRIPNMIRVMAHSPTVLGGYLDFTYAMQRTTLPASLRNQLALVVAEATGSRYFLALAEALSRRDGLGPEEIAAARRAESRDPGARAALRFAALVVQQRGHLPTDEAATLREAGSSDEPLGAIVALVG